MWKGKSPIFFFFHTPFRAFCHSLSRLVHCCWGVGAFVEGESTPPSSSHRSRRAKPTIVAFDSFMQSSIRDRAHFSPVTCEERKEGEPARYLVCLCSTQRDSSMQSRDNETHALTNWATAPAPTYVLILRDPRRERYAKLTQPSLKSPQKGRREEEMSNHYIEMENKV